MWDAWWPAACAGCGAVGPRRLCTECRPPGVHRPPVSVEGLRGVWTLAGYDTGIGVAVRGAKVRGDRHLMAIVGDLLASRVAPRVLGAGFTALVPAPSTVATRWSRGFSAASVLADRLQRVIGVPRVEALRRPRGPRQAALGRKARRSNLKGRLRSHGDVGGRVLLVDDVLTTGATAEACARELLGAGAEEVWLVTVCVARSLGRTTERTAT
jgi:predicted amidophosphoribosyltransferase